VITTSSRLVQTIRKSTECPDLRDMILSLQCTIDIQIEKYIVEIHTI